MGLHVRIRRASSPLGTSRHWRFGPGAEAPGWPYVVPVGDFGARTISRLLNCSVARSLDLSVAALKNVPRRWTFAFPSFTPLLITHKVGSANLFALHFLRIPTGFRPTAQGCALRATLGKPSNDQPQRGCVLWASIPLHISRLSFVPFRLFVSPFTSFIRTQPRWG